MTFFNDKKTNLSRRNLLKGLGACAALPLLGGIFPKSALAQAISTALSQFPTLVPAQKGILTGAHWGAFEAIVEDGRMVRVQPVADDPAPNDLIDMAPFQVHAKNRIKYPMVRKSWLEHGPGAKPELRGADEWVRVSWDKAIELVAGEIQRVQSDFGPQAIHAGSYGWKSVGMFHNSRTLLHRLMNLSGGFTGYAGDYSTGAAQVIMSHVMGSIEVYEQQTAWPNVVENAELVVLWGVNAQVTLKNSWNMPDHEGQAGFMALKEKGTRVISIDPIYNETAKLVGAEWIAPNAYTDVAMMLGVAHTLYSEKKHDQAFLDRYTVGFDKFLAYLLGKDDGQPKS
ncbi:MAG: molybdopterin-dependent oxidoreductase, partial [Aeromonas veronii]